MVPRIHVRNTIEVIRRFLSNIVLICATGPHKKKELPSEQRVPHVYRIPNFKISPFINDLIKPDDMSEIKKPRQNKTAKPLILVLSAILGHKLLFGYTLSVNALVTPRRLGASDEGSASPPPNSLTIVLYVCVLIKNK